MFTRVWSAYQKQEFLRPHLVLDFEQGQLQFSLATSFIRRTSLDQSTPVFLWQNQRRNQTRLGSLLHRFDIVDQGKIDRLMDQALYRLFLFLKPLWAWCRKSRNPLGSTHQTVQPGKLFTNIGFWMACTSFPLLALMAPDTYHDFLEGFLNFYKETGFLPKWLAPDERGMMPGTLIDVIGDANKAVSSPGLRKDLSKPC